MYPSEVSEQGFLTEEESPLSGDPGVGLQEGTVPIWQNHGVTEGL